MLEAKELISRKKQLANTIREFVLENADVCRLIPFAALDLNGRHHWSRRLKLAYEKFLWCITGSVSIDLRTGKLLGPDCEILFQDIHALNPEKILYGLIEKVQNQEFNPGLERPADWETHKEVVRRKLVEELGGEYELVGSGRLS